MENKYEVGQKFYDYNKGMTWEIVGIKSKGEDPIYILHPTEEHCVYLQSELEAMRKTK